MNPINEQQQAEQEEKEFVPMSTPAWVIKHIEMEGNFYEGLKILSEIRNSPPSEIAQIMGGYQEAIELMECIDKISKLSSEKKNKLLDLVLPTS